MHNGGTGGGLRRGKSGSESARPDLCVTGDTHSLLLPQPLLVLRGDCQPFPAGAVSVLLPPGRMAIPPPHRGVTEAGAHCPVLPSHVELASLNLTAAPPCTDNFPREVPRVIISPNCPVSQRLWTAIWSCNRCQVPFAPALWEVRVRRHLEERTHLTSLVSDHCFEGFGPLVGLGSIFCFSLLPSLSPC